MQKIDLCSILNQLFPVGVKQWEIIKLLLSPLAEGLKYLHSKKIVHRDVTSESLFIGSDAKVRLDFFCHFKKANDSCETTNVCGNVCYLAPELFNEHSKKYNHKIDIYAFGALTLEILTGKRLYSDVTFYEAVNKILEEEPPCLKKFSKIIPKKFLFLVEQCLRKNPDDRPTAADLCCYFSRHKVRHSEQKIKEKILNRFEKTALNESNYRRQLFRKNKSF